jgi:hypothetical protein
LTIGSQPTRALDATDQVVHLCWHGAHWNEVPPMRWIPDLMMVFKASGDSIDWVRVVDAARHFCISLPLREGLNYLKDKFEAAVPDWVLIDLDRIHVPSLAGYAYERDLEPFRAPNTARVLRGLRFSYWWTTSGAPFWRKPLIFAKVLQGQFESSWWQLPGRLISRASRRGLRRLVFHLRRLLRGSGASPAIEVESRN